ncbi:MAG: ABC transporter ATP-binding protein [Planctomycetales bacterium]|jgi:putative ABC transport system ATP-binding protein
MQQVKESHISMRQLGKVFLTEEVETHALHEVDMELQRGEFVSIAGPSGCGKSTLLSIMGLLDSATEGEYVLKGQEVGELSVRDRSRLPSREIGFIFEAFHLIGDLTVRENVELPLTYRGTPAADRQQRVEEAFKKVDMSHRMGHYSSQLSGGQQQRVAVARPLAGNPAILLADEPTGNLDSKNGMAVMDLLHELHGKGATICMVTHGSRVSPTEPSTCFMGKSFPPKTRNDLPRPMNRFRRRLNGHSSFQCQ